MKYQMVIKYKVFITEALWDYNYSHIVLKNEGKAIIVRDLTSKEARQIVKENNLQIASIEEADYHYGRIYHDNKIKHFLNTHKRVKKNLIKIIDETQFLN